MILFFIYLEIQNTNLLHTYLYLELLPRYDIDVWQALPYFEWHE